MSITDDTAGEVRCPRRLIMARRETHIRLHEEELQQLKKAKRQAGLSELPYGAFLTILLEDENN